MADQSYCSSPRTNTHGGDEFSSFPDGAYMEYVMKQARDAGIVVPFISNDAAPLGHNAPGTGVGEVDIYGYSLGFDGVNPTVWPADGLPTDWRALHLQQSPSTPYSINEFQAGSFDPWGGWGFEKCSQLVNHEFERVFYKNTFAAGVSILNLYMIFGGTNWGNLGHPGGYTSYDYGSVIREDRTIAREKYSELKLEANFMMVSPAYLTATPAINATHAYSDNAEMIITPLLGKRQNEFNEFAINNAASSFKVIEGGMKLFRLGSNSSASLVLGWPTSTERTIVQVGDLTIYLLDRTSEYNYWVTDVVGSQSKLIVNGPYLLRSVALNGSELSIKANFNVSTPIEVVGAPLGTKAIRISGKETPFKYSGQSPTMNIIASPPLVDLPNLASIPGLEIGRLAT
ncbi:hypothetical protein PG994_009289 [Apiospora phragmitis]|uniref:Beta-galactosidase n=1 Tax=Apiospora phragmitis TaxID=2905665 RepID=A0ABR1UIV6_9PEZI